MRGLRGVAAAAFTSQLPLSDDLPALVLRQGMVMAGVGVTLGLVLAWAASRSLGALLFELPALDPVTYVSVVVLLFGVSGLACWGPAWRAARLDPAITLRAERLQSWFPWGGLLCQMVVRR